MYFTGLTCEHLEIFTQFFSCFIADNISSNEVFLFANSSPFSLKEEIRHANTAWIHLVICCLPIMPFVLVRMREQNSNTLRDTK